MRSVTLWGAILILVFSSTPMRADEAPHARAYLDQLKARLDLIQADMPTITKAAEAAAKAIVNGHDFGVTGDRGLANELSNRAGAMMGYNGLVSYPVRQGDVLLHVIGLERPGGWGMDGVIITQTEGLRQIKFQGPVLIGLGSSSQLRAINQLEKAQMHCDVWLDNHAEPHSEDELAPMQTVLNAAVAWTFQCEVFAALTRLEKVPTVRQGFEIDTRHRRWKYYGSQRFHHDRWLDPISPGKLGGDYLQNLHKVLDDIGSASWKQLTRTANRVEQTMDTGLTVWLRPGGRYLPHHVGGWLANDPDLFKLLTHDGSDPALPAPGKYDYVIAVGRHETAGSHEWGEPELLRQAGRGVTWIVNGYNTQPHDLHRNETLIDLWGPVGDCVVKVENYDTRLGPVSGITSEAVLWMIAAEIQGRQAERAEN